MCETKHDYEGAAATNSVLTTYGTYHLCPACATAMVRGGYAKQIGPLRTSNPAQRCQCEDEAHECRIAVKGDDGSDDVMHPRRTNTDG